MLRRIAGLRLTHETGLREVDPVPQPIRPFDSEISSILPSIKHIQQTLNRLGMKPALEVDGVLGPATRAALLNFQREHGLVEDWAPGPQTCALLEKSIPLSN